MIHFQVKLGVIGGLFFVMASPISRPVNLLNVIKRKMVDDISHQTKQS